MPLSGIAGHIGGQRNRTRGIVFRVGAYLGLRWCEMQTAGCASGRADTLIFSVHPLGNIMAGMPPTGLDGNVPGVPTGRNQRGASSVDFQLRRNGGQLATQVASGAGSGLLAGERNTASGICSVVIGGTNNTASALDAATIGAGSCTASGTQSLCFGLLNTASGAFAAAAGSNSTASGRGGFAMGEYGLANRNAGHLSLGTLGNGWSASAGATMNFMPLGGITTNATPVTLMARTGAGATYRLTVTSGCVMTCLIEVEGALSTGGSVVKYSRRCVIKNVGGTTTLVNAVETIGTDHEDDGTCDVQITADDTNDALQVNVVGPSSGTWRWSAGVFWVELPYGA